MSSPRGMTGTLISWTRVLWTLPRTIFICNQILPRSMPAQLRKSRWENWILMVHHESDPGKWTSAATKDNRRKSMLNSDVNRREFLKITAGASAALAIPSLGHAAVSSSKMIGIQVGAISFVDEGTGRVLDIL